MKAQTPVATATQQQRADRRVVITTLGLTQIFAWGSSYYLLAVLAKPIAADTGWPLSLVVGGVSLGLLAAGTISPRVGRAIDRHGGRPVLSASSALLAAGLAGLSLAPSAPAYLAAWVVIGLGMGAGLYDAAFAALGRIYGKEARRAITQLTLWGGFASTVCWPLSAYLVESLGWRGACFAYAALQLALALPAHLLLLPRARTPATIGPAAPTAPDPPAVDAAPGPVLNERRALLLMAGVVTIGGAASSLFSVHLLTLLQSRDLPLSAAVSLGVLIGPSQVGARVVEMAFGRRYHPIWTLVSALVLIASGLALLAAGFSLPAVALVLYGAGNGIYSIGRGTLPLALFGSARYPVLMGRLALPSLLAQALAPSAGALILEHGGAGWTFALLALLATLNVVLVVALWIGCRPSGASLPAGRARTI